MGRHTFATMMLSNGVSLPNVASMLGHTKTEQTLVYAKVLAEVVRKDFDKMDEILKNRPASQ
jgi:site-specific recombinase XerD